MFTKLGEHYTEEFEIVALVGRLAAEDTPD